MMLLVDIQVKYTELLLLMSTFLVVFHLVLMQLVERLVKGGIQE